MLSRPEIGSREHIMLWLASKDPRATYNWTCPFSCACATYSDDSYGQRYYWVNMLSLHDLNKLAYLRPWTYGALYKRARKAWA